VTTFSPGKFWKSVPTDPRQNALWRLEFIDEAARRGDRTQRRLRRMCAEDFHFHFNAFLFTNNPEVYPHVHPFVLHDFQAEALREVGHTLFVEQKSVIIEKGRKLGASWCALGLLDWRATFYKRQKFLAVSHNLEAVENGPDDQDSLFWKVRFVHEHLPDWLRGEVVGGSRRSPGFGYRGTRSAFTGKSTSERSGVGGRATAVLLDEFGKMLQDYEIFAQTADTGPRLIISTHYGLGTAFYKYTRPDAGIKKIQWHWTQHPAWGRGRYKYEPESPDAGPDGIVRLDDYPFPPDYPFDRSGKPHGGIAPKVRSPWYDEAVKGRGDRDTAQHIDVNPEGASAQFFDGQTVSRLIRDNVRPPLWTGDLLYDPVTGKPEGLRKREGGALQLWTLPDAYGRVRPSKYGAGSDISFGSGHTPSTVAVGDAWSTPPGLVALYADAHLGTEEFAAFCAALCRTFADESGHGALFCWESQGPAGAKFGTEMVRQLGYENSWEYEDDELLKRRGRAVRPGKRYGYPAMPKQKNLLLKELRDATQTGRLLVPSEATLRECLAYQFNDRGDKVFHGGAENADDPRAGTVNHGDRVIAVALMWKMLVKLGARETEQVRQQTRGWAPGTVGWDEERARAAARVAAADGLYGRAVYLRRR
jgi:hypothetical protein